MNDPDLDRLLHAWRAPDVPADSFRRSVWQRIADSEAAAPRWLRWLDPLLRPRMALTGIAAALFVGTAGGIAHAALTQKAGPPNAADSTAAYMQSINPLDPVHLRNGDMR